MKDAVVSALGFAPIAPQRAFEDIAAQIRDLVAGGKLKPGDRLPAERDLSAKFNVSRNTLREALRALELSGMIELRKGASGGAFVLPGNSGVVVNGLRDLYHLGAITPEHLTEARISISADRDPHGLRAHHGRRRLCRSWRPTSPAAEHARTRPATFGERARPAPPGLPRDLLAKRHAQPDPAEITTEGGHGNHAPVRRRPSARSD